MRANLSALAVLACIAALSGPASAQLVFETPAAADGGSYVVRTLVGDLNEDGFPDLVAGHFVFGGGPTVSFGLGGGQFGPPQWLSPLGGNNTAGFGALADFNGDGHLDLLGFIGQDPPFTVSVLLGTGRGTFGPPVGINGNYHSAYEAEVGDFDADGALDVAISNGPFGFFNGAILAVFGNGDGTFGEPITLVGPTQLLPFGTAARIRVGDANGDGLDDIVYSTANGTPTLISQGNGSFVVAACGVQGCGVMSDSDFVLADVNGDGRQDIVTNLRVMPANHNGTFGFGQTFPLQQVPLTVDVGDLDGDGILDVVIGRNWTTTFVDPGQTDGDVMVLRGLGNGSFQTTGLLVSHVPQPRDVTIADVDADGRADVVVGDFQVAPASMRILLNRTYGPGSPFLDLGGALGGSNGYPIQLASGTLVAGQPFAFKLQNGPPSGAAYHVVGLNHIDAPFKGGVMIPSINLVNGPFPLTATGALTLAGNWPAGGSGLTLWVQFWMPNGGGPAGLVASSGVRAQIP